MFVEHLVSCTKRLVNFIREVIDMEKWVEDYRKKEQRFEDYLKERETKDKELLKEYFTLIYNFKKTLGLNYLNITLKDLRLSDMPSSHPSKGEFVVKTKYLSVYGGGFDMVDIRSKSTNHYVYMSEMDLGVEYRLFLRDMKNKSNVGENNFDMVLLIVLCCICVLLLIVFIFLFWL